MLDERGFERKQARVHGVSGKVWVGLRLKTDDELMRETPGENGKNGEQPGVKDCRLPWREDEV